jgi:hypothetical protein
MYAATFLMKLPHFLKVLLDLFSTTPEAPPQKVDISLYQFWYRECNRLLVEADKALDAGDLPRAAGLFRQTRVANRRRLLAYKEILGPDDIRVLLDIEDDDRKILGFIKRIDAAREDQS